MGETFKKTLLEVNPKGQKKIEIRFLELKIEGRYPSLGAEQLREEMEILGYYVEIAYARYWQDMRYLVALLYGEGIITREEANKRRLEIREWLNENFTGNYEKTKELVDWLFSKLLPTEIISLCTVMGDIEYGGTFTNMIMDKCREEMPRLRAKKALERIAKKELEMIRELTKKTRELVTVIPHP